MEIGEHAWSTKKSFSGIIHGPVLVRYKQAQAYLQSDMKCY